MIWAIFQDIALVLLALFGFCALIVLMGIAFDAWDYIFGEDGHDPQDLD